MAESKLKSSIMKSLDTITESLKSLETRVKALEEPAPEPEDEEVVVAEEKSKEEASSKIEGSSDAGSPDDSNPDANNEVYLFKSMAEKLNKRFDALEKSINTQKSASPRTEGAGVAKSNVNPVEIALGTKKLQRSEVHKAAKQGWR